MYFTIIRHANSCNKHEHFKMTSLFNNICSILHGIENYHDTISVPHESRTGHLMSVIGQAFGMEPEDCVKLGEVGAIHDIGKIAIPREIIEKPGPLSIFERKVVELHPIAGHDFIKHVKHPLVELAATVILTHHENFDGTGYPNGLIGKEIPIGGRICAISDVYDALRNTRPYRQRISHEDTYKMIYDKGTNGLHHKFCPDILEVFRDISNEIKAIYL